MNNHRKLSQMFLWCGPDASRLSMSGELVNSCFDKHLSVTCRRMSGDARIDFSKPGYIGRYAEIEQNTGAVYLWPWRDNHPFSGYIVGAGYGVYRKHYDEHK